MKELYKIIRHEHGWLICSAAGKEGVPCNALQECLPMFPKDSVIETGIAHHYNICDNPGGKVVFAIATPSEAEKWKKEIDEELSALHPTMRWWYGTDVGMSSSVIFSVLSVRNGYDGLATVVEKFGNGRVPHDSDDLGRCLRLLENFPDWEKDLNKVAEAYPDTAWPKIVERWQELKTAGHLRQNEILSEINESM